MTILPSQVTHKHIFLSVNDDLSILDLISNDLLKMLNIPGDVREWDKMLRSFRELELSDVVFDLVTLAKAPGTREQWEDILHPVKKVLQFLAE